VVASLAVEEKSMTVREVAVQCRVNEDTVRRWLRTGKLKGRNLGGRGGYRIPPAEVRRFMEEGRDGA
jgi:excisionase family DNA binding protein